MYDNIFQKDTPSLSKVQVLVKLICTEDNAITNKVVRGTNKQNQVLEESFETTKPFHQELEDYLQQKRNRYSYFMREEINNIQRTRR